MKKVGLLVLALVIALGGLGVGYAMWSDTINIQGSVNTAEVCIGFTSASSFDDCDSNTKDYTVKPGEDCKWAITRATKDVGCTTAVISPDGKTVTVTLYNAYPGYLADVEIHIDNCGDIPVRIQDFVITPVGDYTISATDCDWVTSGPSELAVKWYGGLIGEQLHPDEEGVSGSFLVLVDQSAVQDTIYEFTVEITGVQWNEYQAP